MKITSGKYKYRNIEVPRGIRPTTEKVREAVFSMLMQWLPDAEVLDLFAGTGSVADSFNDGKHKIVVNDILECNRCAFNAFFGSEEIDEPKNEEEEEEEEEVEQRDV